MLARGPVDAASDGLDQVIHGVAASIGEHATLQVALVGVGWIQLVA